MTGLRVLALKLPLLARLYRVVQALVLDAILVAAVSFYISLDFRIFTSLVAGDFNHSDSPLHATALPHRSSFLDLSFFPLQMNLNLLINQLRFHQN